MRDTSRSLQLKLRDIEVVNDDYERQARNTTSSLEDMESKFNVAIERGVLLEEEIHNGEQEREGLRIENQRLRDELSDLRIEHEITLEKLRDTESQGRHRKPAMPLSRSPSTPHTNFSRSTAAADGLRRSPSLYTTPVKPLSISATGTPPSPPISETSASLRKSVNAIPGFPLQRASGAEKNSRSLHGPKAQKQHAHSRSSLGRSTASSHPTPSNRQISNSRHTASSSISSIPTASILNNANSRTGSPAPKSESLNQIRGLIGKMQKLEQRVQSAKSRLPAPVESHLQASPRSGSVSGQSHVAPTVTMRRKRLSGTSHGSSVRDGETTPSSYVPNNSTSRRQSLGSRTQGDSRPSSRTSFSSRSSYSQSTPAGTVPPTRPESRQSANSSRMPKSYYSTTSALMLNGRRPRSSLSNGHQSPPPAAGGSMRGMGNIDEISNDIHEDVNKVPLTIRNKPNELRRPSITTTALNNGTRMRAVSGVSGIPTPRHMKTNDGEDRKARTSGLGETF